MLKFFRKVRQKLLQENRFSKYLLYAIGEIILVVIGILIALYIDNQNEQEKSARIVDDYLKELTIELDLNIDYLELRRERNIQDIDSIRAYLGHFNVASPKEVSLERINLFMAKIGPIRWTPLSSATWNDFNNSGYITTINDSELRRKIIEIEKHSINFDTYREEAANTWINGLAPFYLEHGNLVEMDLGEDILMLPSVKSLPNKSAFINNRKLNNLLMFRAMSKRRTNMAINSIIQKFQDTKNLIADYRQNRLE